MLDLFWCLGLLNIVGVWWTYKEHETALAKFNKPGFSVMTLIIFLSLLMFIVFGICGLFNVSFNATMVFSLMSTAAMMMTLCYFSMMVVVEGFISYFVFLFFTVMNLNLSHIALTFMRS